MKSIYVLQKHQMWRKGGTGPQVNPKLLSLAIGEAIESMSKLEELEAQIEKAISVLSSSNESWLRIYLAKKGLIRALNKLRTVK